MQGDRWVDLKADPLRDGSRPSHYLLNLVLMSGQAICLILAATTCLESDASLRITGKITFDDSSDSVRPQR